MKRAKARARMGSSAEEQKKVKAKEPRTTKGAKERAMEKFAGRAESLVIRRKTAGG